MNKFVASSLLCAVGGALLAFSSPVPAALITYDFTVQGDPLDPDENRATGVGSLTISLYDWLATRNTDTDGSFGGTIRDFDALIEFSFSWNGTQYGRSDLDPEVFSVRVIHSVEGNKITGYQVSQWNVWGHCPGGYPCAPGTLEWGLGMVFDRNTGEPNLSHVSTTFGYYPYFGIDEYENFRGSISSASMTASVPEPTSLAFLLGLGIVGMGFVRLWKAH